MGGAATAACNGAAASADSSGGAKCSTPSVAAEPLYCLVQARFIRVPGAKRLALGQTVLTKVDDQTAVLVTRDAAGFYALSAICTHACCLVSLCRDSGCGSTVPSPDDCGTTVATVQAVETTVICPCHGSAFRLSDGSPLNGPAVTPLPAYALTFDGEDAVVDTGTVVAVTART